MRSPRAGRKVVVSMEGEFYQSPERYDAELYHAGVRVQRVADHRNYGHAGNRSEYEHDLFAGPDPGEWQLSAAAARLGYHDRSGEIWGSRGDHGDRIRDRDGHFARQSSIQHDPRQPSPRNSVGQRKCVYRMGRPGTRLGDGL